MKKLTKLLSAVLVLVLLLQLAPVFSATEAEDPLDGQEVEYCEYCGVAEGEAHLEGCDYYVDDTPDCTCGAYYFTNQLHLDTCYYYEPVCCCDYATTGIHAAYCDLYEGPVCTCDYDVTGIHADYCDFYQDPDEEPTCTCDTTEDFHYWGCPLYVEPEMGVYASDAVQAFVDAVNALPYDEIVAYYACLADMENNRYNNYVDGTQHQINMNAAADELAEALNINIASYVTNMTAAASNPAYYMVSELEKRFQTVINLYTAAKAEILASDESAVQNAFAIYEDLSEYWSLDPENEFKVVGTKTDEIKVHLFNYNSSINTTYINDGLMFSSANMYSFAKDEWAKPLQIFRRRPPSAHWLYTSAMRPSKISSR